MIEIRSAQAALIEAERLLATVSEEDTSTALWKSSAVYPFAAILLAVTHDSGGQATLAAVHNVAARPDAGANNPGCRIGTGPQKHAPMACWPRSWSESRR